MKTDVAFSHSNQQMRSQETTPLISSQYYQQDPLKTDVIYSKTYMPYQNQMTNSTHLNQQFKSPLNITTYTGPTQSKYIPEMRYEKMEKNMDKKRQDISYQTQLTLPNDQMLVNYENIPSKQNLNVSVQSHIGNNEHKIGIDKMIYDDTKIHQLNDKHMNIPAQTNLKYIEKYSDINHQKQMNRKSALILDTNTITNKDSFGYEMYDIQSRNASHKTNHSLQPGSFNSGGSYIPKMDRITNDTFDSNLIEDDYVKLKKRASSQYMERYNDIFK